MRPTCAGLKRSLKETSQVEALIQKQAAAEDEDDGDDDELRETMKKGSVKHLKLFVEIKICRKASVRSFSSKSEALQLSAGSGVRTQRDRRKFRCWTNKTQHQPEDVLMFHKTTTEEAAGWVSSHSPILSSTLETVGRKDSV